MPYEDSSVSVGRTQEAIKALLAKHGVIATRFTSYPGFALLEFVHGTTGGPISFRIRVKPKLEPGKGRNIDNTLDRAERQVWRVVYWWLKAKMEAIEFGLVEFEQELLPYMLVVDQSGKSAPAAELFFQRLAGAVKAPDDPFGGILPLPPPAQE